MDLIEKDVFITSDYDINKGVKHYNQVCHGGVINSSRNLQSESLKLSANITNCIANNEVPNTKVSYTKINNNIISCGGVTFACEALLTEFKMKKFLNCSEIPLNKGDYRGNIDKSMNNKNSVAFFQTLNY